MGETLFSIDGGNFRDCHKAFRGEHEQEYYRGDFWIEASARIEVRSERKRVGPVAIIRQRSDSNLFFRRTRQHIREDATDLSILWFVKYGKVTFSNQCGTQAVLPGGFAITRSMAPFFMECQVDADRVHEVLHVTLPTYVLREHLPCDTSTGLFLANKPPELTIAESILGDVFEDEGLLAEDAARLLVETALTLIARGVHDQAGVPLQQTITERRQQDLLRFIEVHLSNPKLSPKMAARGCGISPRYLSTLMQLNGTSFSDLVWGQRLERARQCLASIEAEHTSIAEIAYGLGFKSPAHFSRMFKRVFKLNPRDFRNHHLRGSILIEIKRDEADAATLQ